MAINPNIALQAKGIELENPMAAYGRAQQIMANKMAMDTSQRSLQSQNALRAYVQGGGRLDTPEGIQAALQTGVDPKTVYEVASSRAEYEQKQLKAAEDRINYHRNLLSAVGDERTYQSWLSGVEKESPEIAQRYRDFSPNYDPNKLPRIAMDAKALLDATVSRRTATPMVGENGGVYGVEVGGIGPGVANEVVTGGAAPVAAQAPAEAGAVAPVGGPAEGGDVEALLAKIAARGAATQSEMAILSKVVKPEAFQQLQQRMQQSQIPVVADNAPVASSGVPTGRGGVGGPYEPAAVNAPGTPFRGKPLYEPAASAGARAAATREPVDYVGATAEARREPIASAAEREYRTELARLRAAQEAAANKPLTPGEQIKRRDQIAKDYRTAQTAIDGFVDVINKAAQVRDLPKEAKEALTGVSGYFPSLTSSARTADTRLTNLRGAVTAMGKAAAAQSGALGNMAVQEWKIISDQVAGLDEKKMEPADLDAQINLIINRAKIADANLRDAYYQQYEPDLQKMPGKFQLKTIKPGPKYRPGGAGVDTNNPLLRGGR